MGLSYAIRLQTSCPRCGGTVDHAVWLILDEAEHPTLLRDAISRSNPRLRCAACGLFIGVFDAPLLLHGGQPPQVLLVPAGTTTPEENREQLASLLEVARQRTPDQAGQFTPEAAQVINRADLVAAFNAPEQLPQEIEDLGEAWEPLAQWTLQQLAEPTTNGLAELVAAWEAFVAASAAAQVPAYLAAARVHLAQVRLRLYELSEDDRQLELAERSAREVLAAARDGAPEEVWSLLSETVRRLGAALPDAESPSGTPPTLAILARWSGGLDPELQALAHARFGADAVFRYRATRDDDEAVVAERHLRAAAEIWTPGGEPVRWGWLEQNLGLLRHAAYGIHAREHDWHAARQRLVNALKAGEGAGDADLVASAHLHLGLLSLHRFEQFRAEAQFLEAEQHLVTAIGIGNARRPDWTDGQEQLWAEAHEGLGDLYGRRYSDGGGDSLGRMAQAHYQSALRVYGAHRGQELRWAGVQQTLANLLVTAYDRTGDERDAAMAREAASAALRILRRGGTPFGWARTHVTLSVLALKRYEHTRSPIALGRAARHAALALTIAERRRLPPDLAVNAAALLSQASFRRREWHGVADAYDRAAAILDRVLDYQVTRAAKESWLRPARGLAVAAAWAWAKLDKPVRAVAALEHGRARLLSDALARDRADLGRLRAGVVAPELASQYEEAAEILARLEVNASNDPAGEAAAVKELTAARTRLQDTISAIRKLPGFELFLATPTVDDLQAMAAAAPLVYLLTTPAGGLALVVHSGGVEQVPLPMPTEDLNNLLAGDPHDESTPAYLRATLTPDGEGLDAALADALPLLGERVLSPVARVLETLGRREVVLIACGHLGLLPLHAAIYKRSHEQVSLLDEFDVVYAPSGRALAAAKLASARGSYGEDAPGRLLAVGDPQSAGSQRAAFTDVLAVRVAEQAGAEAPLLRADATTSTLLERLRAGPVRHLLLGCHGIFEPAEPLQSGLELADGRLTLATLLTDLRLLGGPLVTLGACQTALTDYRELPDEVVGLPAGFLQVGAGGVVGTLWPVDALATVLVLHRFSGSLLDGAAPYQALTEAVRWLRSLDRTGLQESVQALVASPAVSPKDALALEYRASRAYDGLRPFAAPQFWAGFAYTGGITGGRP